MDDNISISKSVTRWTRQIYSSSILFKAGERYVFKIKETFILISKADFDYIGKTYKATKCKRGIKFGVSGELPIGRFQIALDESNEDEVKIYYE